MINDRQNRRLETYPLFGLCPQRNWTMKGPPTPKNTQNSVTTDMATAADIALVHSVYHRHAKKGLVCLCWDPHQACNARNAAKAQVKSVTLVLPTSPLRQTARPLRSVAAAAWQCGPSLLFTPSSFTCFFLKFSFLFLIFRASDSKRAWPISADCLIANGNPAS